jgi:hypothetical protein
MPVIRIYNNSSGDPRPALSNGSIKWKSENNGKYKGSVNIRKNMPVRDARANNNQTNEKIRT